MRLTIALGLAALVGCGDNAPSEERQGGDTTVDDRTPLAFTHPAANLTSDDAATWQAGEGPFAFHWVMQLGPLYNNDSCAGCHTSFGRGLSEIGPSMISPEGAYVSEALVRCSLATGTPSVPGGDVPVPGYGLQLQDHAVDGMLSEIVVSQGWTEVPTAYGDGTLVSLRSPALGILTPMGAMLPAGTLTSYRQAPPLIGLGLLQAVDDATLMAMADPDDADGDGISGRVNMVWDDEQQATVVGRFGMKANTSTLHLQAAAAALNDIGLTNRVFPPTDGSDPDVSDIQLEQMAFFVATIGVPAAAPRNPQATLGRQRFDDFGCSSCHVPTLVTGDSTVTPELSHQTIHPYTDLLLHDMGDGLADNRPDFEATGTEWRTLPLWGIGLTNVVLENGSFLHDGRARTLEEAILWHGGEAQPASDAFRNAAEADRDALIAFLDTL